MIIEFLSQSTETCLSVMFSSKVTGDEYLQFIDAVDARPKNNEKINIVLVLTGFEFYGDFASAKMDIKFGFGEYKHVQKAAFVGDQKWIEWFTRLMGPFTRTEEKHFDENQYEAACIWACM